MHGPLPRLAALVAVLALTACGGSDDGDDAASDSTAPTDSRSSTADPSASPAPGRDRPADKDRPGRSDRPGSTDRGSDPDGSDSTDQGDEPSHRDLRSALLTQSVMPTGWSEVPTDGDGSGDLCDVDIAELLGVPERSLRRADVQYALDEDTGPSVVESIGLVPSGRSSELLDGVREGFEDCEGEVQGMQVSVSELDLPTLADDSAAYEIHVGSGEGSLDIPLVYAISGDLVIGVYAVDVSADPVELLEKYAPRAVDKALRVLA
jgi:hypothetical protein